MLHSSLLTKTNRNTLLIEDLNSQLSTLAVANAEADHRLYEWREKITSLRYAVHFVHVQEILTAVCFSILPIVASDPSYNLSSHIERNVDATRSSMLDWVDKLIHLLREHKTPAPSRDTDASIGDEPNIMEKVGKSSVRPILHGVSFFIPPNPRSLSTPNSSRADDTAPDHFAMREQNRPDILGALQTDGDPNTASNARADECDLV
ncbi:hypothetical protein BC936DRAFT_149764 [Jimgerdemannia flammicorona]|uniref:Uncharacterized protein n=1 Tax=Jimgerdemannia flammicorona TaxID=994334 RepID=A0A433DK96_9FUNG|nr:hypothetical protein BC936DRAFT_149764 [Jimgerdemannia flammicorona]